MRIGSIKQYILGPTIVLGSVFFSFGHAHAIEANDPEKEQWAYETIGLYDAWSKAQGSRDIIVAVVDGGFDTFHTDLRRNVWINEDEVPSNGIDDDRNGYIDDRYGWNFVASDTDGDGKISALEEKGNNDPRPSAANLNEFDLLEGTIHHGTVVAGLIGAVGNNNLDGVGVNWNVRLMNIKVIEENGSGNVRIIADGVRYAVDNGADIINISLVTGIPDHFLNEAIDYAYDRGVLVVAAAGNSRINMNNNRQYPVCLDADDGVQKVIGVSAITPSRRLTHFSNTGSDCIDITAPGLSVRSTMRYSPRDGLDDRYGGAWSGTSFAAPLVSGAAALVKSIQTTWGPAELFDALIKTVHHTPGQDESVYANIFGAGLLQVDKAVDYALGGSPVSASTIASRVTAISLNDGSRALREQVDAGAAETQELEKLNALSDGDRVAAFYDGGALKYAVVNEIRGVSQLQIVDEDNDIVREWSLGSSGAFDVTAADIMGDATEEVIVSPLFGDDQLYRVYSLSGVLLAEKSINALHSGVSITSFEGNKKEVVVFYRVDDEVLIETYTADGIRSNEIAVGAIKTTGDVTVGDIDADGVEEYIIAAGAGEDPFLVYYETDGRLKRKFWAYPGSYREGLRLMATDFDKDGRDDIVTWSSRGSVPVRVWNYRSKKLDEWTPFEGEGLHIDFVTQ